MVSNPGFACHDKARVDTPRGRSACGSAMRAGGGLSCHVLCRALPQKVNEIDLLLCRLIDEEYTRHPFFGSRKRVVFLKTQGHIVNRKRVQSLMRAMSLVAGGFLTTGQIKERDRRVFQAARAHGLSIAWNLAGGYQRDAEGSIRPVLEIHDNTMRMCAAESVNCVTEKRLYMKDSG